MSLTTAARKRPTVAARRSGYLVAGLVNAAVLYATNAWPGWEEVPFLTDDTRSVLPLVNASIIVGLVANLLYLISDPRWLKALGDILTTAVGVVAMVRIWQIFPFDFGDSSFDWTLLVHTALAVGIVGSAIGVIVGFVSLAKAARPAGSRPTGRPPIR
jgi:hypothetical protein